LGALDRFWARSVRRFIFISQWVADDVVAQGIPVNRGRLIYDGLETDRYAVLPDHSAACAALGISPDRPTVAVVGRLVPWKGQELFLRAMRRVVDAMPEAQGLIVGDVESFSRDFGDRLRALRAELGLDAAVHLLGHLADPSPVYASIDLLAHTSVTPEPFGLVMIEAMASGLPVVTPVEGGGPEIIVDGVTGHLFAPGDPDALAAAILDLLSHPDRARTMGVAGRERVQQCFTLDRFVAEMTVLYRSLHLPRGAA
jgi:glycosyltransferase involved in cell wall biosynthesis